MPMGFVSFREVKGAVSLESILRRYELFSDLKVKGANLVGTCPFCESPSTQQFQVNCAKSAWYCFACKAGGNVLDFVAKREKVSVRSAAVRLNDWFSLGLLAEVPPAPAAPPPAVPPPIPAPVPSANPPLTFALKTLHPAHPALAPLSLKPERIQTFGAGYATKGLMRGRLAIPIHTRAGALVAYAGLALDDATSPRYLYPPNFNPALEVMNLHRLSTSAQCARPLYLAPEILGVLRLVQAGFSSVLGLFDGSLSTEQETAIAELRTRYERLVCLGQGFAERTIARLARHLDVRWLSGLAADPNVAAGPEPLPLEEAAI